VPKGSGCKGLGERGRLRCSKSAREKYRNSVICQGEVRAVFCFGGAADGRKEGRSLHFGGRTGVVEMQTKGIIHE